MKGASLRAYDSGSWQTAVSWSCQRLMSLARPKAGAAASPFRSSFLVWIKHVGMYFPYGGQHVPWCEVVKRQL